jgi:hypothetical protein
VDNSTSGIFGTRVAADGSVPAASTIPGGGLLSDMPGQAARYLGPVMATGGDRTLLVWTDNKETQEQQKGVGAALLWPW